MNEQISSPDSRSLETSEETSWRSPEYVVVETALEVTAYALGDR